MKRTHMWITAVCLTAVWAYWALNPSSSATPKVPTVPFEKPQEWLPRLQQGETVALVRSERQGLDDSESEVPDLVQVGKIESLGPLEGEDLRFMEGMFLESLRASEEELQGLEATIDPQDSGDLKREADLIQDIELRRAAIDAFRRGSYFVEEKYGAHQSRNESPDLTFQALSGYKDGQRVSVCVVIEHAKYPQLENAKMYYGTQTLFHLSEVVRKFNELSHSRRASLVSRWEEIRTKQRAGEITSDEWAFIVENFPHGVGVNQTSLIMSVIR